jgi:hypothetical protein
VKRIANWLIKWNRALRVHVLVLACVVVAPAQTIPPVKAKSLNDLEITLPDPANNRVLILLTGFSHKSGDAIRVWAKYVSADFHENSRVAYFQMPNLQGAPGFVKPMILSAMRRGTPDPEQPHFVPIYDHKAEWQKLVQYSVPDDAYLIVATPDGHPVWQTHGPYSPAAYAELKKAVSSFLHE